MRELTALLIAVTYGAVLIAAWGFTSLAIDVDVITEKDAGPLLGPAIATGAIVVTWLWIVRRRQGAKAILSGLAAAASVLVVMLLVGGIGYMLTRGEVVWLLLFASKYATSPFVIIPALLAGVAVAITPTAKPFARLRGRD